MRKPLFHMVIVVIIICLYPLYSFAKTGYVSDMLLLTLRQGPASTYPVIKTLPSNTPVTILEEGTDFLKIKLQSNEIGWVDKKFIVFDLPKNIIIEQLKKENEILKQKILKLESPAGTFNDETLSSKSDESQQITSLEASLKAALDEKTTLENLLSESKEKYDALVEQSKNIQRIHNENKILQVKNSELTKALELEMNKGENKSIFKADMIKWFLSGVGVLLMGWIIGKSVSSKKKRSSSLLG